MPEIEKKKYKKNYLSQVVCQLNFAALEAVNDTSMKAYKESLGNGYAELSTVMQKGIVIQNDGTDLHTEVEDKNMWQIESSDKSHTIVISKETLTINFTHYEGFRQYIEIVEKAHELFFGVFQDLQQINRLGLRYINQIKIEQTDVNWAEYIDSKLTESLKFVDYDKIRRSMHSLVIEHDDETRINFNYGIFNQYFPAPVIDNEFIIDFDAYASSAVKASECRKLIEKFNTIIAIYFEKSITDKLREKMEIINE
jgi:uncharacterized protein (TIGR04255 family)